MRLHGLSRSIAGNPNTVEARSYDWMNSKGAYRTWGDTHHTQEIFAIVGLSLDEARKAWLFKRNEQQ